MIDLKKLEESLSDERIIELVTELGSDTYKNTQDAIIFKTICHNVDSENASLKLYYYKKNHRFVCFTECNDSFNIYELFKRRYELLGIKYNFYTDIILKIAGKQAYESQFFKTEEQYISIGNKIKKQTIQVNIPEIPNHLLNIYSFYPTIEWISDGISIDTMKKYNILYSQSQNKIIIPHYDIDNRLIGIRGRALNDSDIQIGKYMPVQIEGKIYSHPLGYNLYGLNMNKDNIKKNKMAIIVEGEKSVLLYDTFFGTSNNISVAVCGSSISHYQIELLRKVGAEKILIAFDNPSDPKLYKEKNMQYNKLRKICEKYSYILKMGFIIDEQNLLDAKDSPLDKGKDIFQKLTKHIQWV